MLDSETIKKIEEFVYLKPRSVSEIAKLINKNWRTADRYIDEIEKEYGTISARVFRGGTRGALKIVFWSSFEKVSSNVFQNRLEEEINHAKRKEDFSAFDIYQHVKNKNKQVSVKEKDEHGLRDFAKLLMQAEKQVMLFSGNLSFINEEDKDMKMIEVIDNLVKKGVRIKVLCRVDIVGKNNIEKMLSLNFKNNRELIEIRHNEHPIRAGIIDDKIIRIKEEKMPTGKCKELNKKIFLYYLIKDKEWVHWMTKIFNNKFSHSVDAKIRLDELNNIEI